MRFLALAASVLLVMLAGCGAEEPGERATEGSSETPTTTVPETTPTVEVRLYFLRNGKVGVVHRRVAAVGVSGAEEPRIERGALEALLEGPTPADRKAGLATAIPRDTMFGELEIVDGTADVLMWKLPSPAARAQVVYTLTQFPSVERVSFRPEAPVDRAAFEEQTPAILVESPAPWDQVSSPLRINGSANTFEATFQAEIVNGEGRVLGKRFVTATSGSGERGTFDASVPFQVEGAGPYKLVVYELSAEDGSRINEVEVLLDLLAE